MRMGGRPGCLSVSKVACRLQREGKSEMDGMHG